MCSILLPLGLKNLRGRVRDKISVRESMTGFDLLPELIYLGLWKENGPNRLHLGCGEQYLQGYINIDYPSSQHTVQHKVVADVFADIRSIVLPEKCVDEIRLHHVFEHFDRSSALAQLIRWHEWLKINGTIHIETPDTMGCAKILVSDTDYATKQAVMRHAFGSQEAHWAYHLDGWYQEKFQKVLSLMGFNVEFKVWNWDSPPYLPNIDVYATKERHLKRYELLAAADLVLADSKVRDVPSERKMWVEWKLALRDELLNLQQEPADVDPIAPFERVSSSSPFFLFHENALLSNCGYGEDDSTTNGEFSLVLNFIDPGSVVFDVGANKGYWSRFVLQNKSEVTLHAFEPVPENFQRLKTTLRGLSAECHPIAVSNRNGDSIFYYYSSSSEIAEMSTFYRRPEVEQKLKIQPSPIQVESSTLNSVCEKEAIPTVDFLKIDTEGSEYEVLLGADPLLQGHKIRMIQFEYGGTYRDAGITLQQIWAYLTGYGYQLFRILPAGLLSIPEWRSELENYTYANYLAVIPEISLKIFSQGIEFEKAQSLVTGLIFSKDRPLQLEGTLRTLFAHCKDVETISLKVLYKASDDTLKALYSSLAGEFPSVDFVSEADFRGDLLEIIELAGEFIFFLVDDAIFTHDFSLVLACAALLNTPSAIGCSFRLGENTTYCYPHDRFQTLPVFHELGNGIMQYDWASAELDFGYPLEVSASLFRTHDICPYIKRLDFNNPNLLEEEMANCRDIFIQKYPTLLCFRQSVAFCAPVNKVQNIAPNRSGNRSVWSTRALANLYKKGYRLDRRAYDGFVSNACHQEIELKLTRAKSSDPAISVVIPCHNYAQYLREAVESVCSQTFRDFEIIIVDDGSTDDTKEVAEQLIEEHSDCRIKLILQPASGQAAMSRNCGIARGVGEYILPLDADDRIENTMLEKCLLLLDSNPEIAIAYPDAVYISEETSWVVMAQEYDFKVLCQANQFSYCALYRRTAFQAVGGYKNVGYEDWEFWISCGEKGFHGKRIPESLFYYRVKPEGVYAIQKQLDERIRAQIVVTHPQLYSEEILEQAHRLLITVEGLPAFSPAHADWYLQEINKVVISGKFSAAKILLHILLIQMFEKDWFYDFFEASLLPFTDWPEILISAMQNDIKVLCASKPDDPKPLYCLAVLYEMVGNFQVARALFRQIDLMGYKTTIVEEHLGQLDKRIEEKGQSTFLPVVSVILPTYNRPALLERAIRSVLAQTFQEFEIIVVNDAGEDIHFVLDPLNHDGRIVYIQHEANRGLAAARNTGIRAARGKYICYLDDDDRLYINHLETLVTFLENSEYEVVYTDAHRAWQRLENGKLITYQVDLPYSYDFDRDLLVGNNFIPVLCIMHTRTCLDEFGLFDESLPVLEDYELWLRISEKYPFVHLPQVTCEFSWREDGSTMTSSKQEQFTQIRQEIFNRYRLPQMEVRVRQLEEEVNNLNAVIESKNRHLSELEQELYRANAQMSELKQVLYQANAQMSEIHGSRGWKMVRIMWSIRLWLLPPGSVREKFVRWAYRIIRPR